MSRPLISSDNSLWRNTVGVVKTIVILPLAVVIKLIVLPFERPLKRTSEEVVRYLRDFVGGTGGEWDWDDFTCCPISDPQLEAIRVRACDIQLPLDDIGFDELRSLLEDATKIASSENAGED